VAQVKEEMREREAVVQALLAALDTIVRGAESLRQ
jgi:hypothetical protein